MARKRESVPLKDKAWVRIQTAIFSKKLEAKMQLKELERRGEKLTKRQKTNPKVNPVAGWTDEEICKQVGIRNRNSFNKLRNGERVEAEKEQLIKLAALLGICPNKLSSELDKVDVEESETQQSIISRVIPPDDVIRRGVISKTIEILSSGTLPGNVLIEELSKSVFIKPDKLLSIFDGDFTNVLQAVALETIKTIQEKVLAAEEDEKSPVESMKTLLLNYAEGLDENAFIVDLLFYLKFIGADTGSYLYKEGFQNELVDYLVGIEEKYFSNHVTRVLSSKRRREDATLKETVSSAAFIGMSLAMTAWNRIKFGQRLNPKELSAMAAFSYYGWGEWHTPEDISKFIEFKLENSFSGDFNMDNKFWSESEQFDSKRLISLRTFIQQAVNYYFSVETSADAKTALLRFMFENFSEDTEESVARVFDRK